MSDLLTIARAAAEKHRACPSRAGDDPSQRELAELTKLIRELASLEGWTEQELAARLWERAHMAPANVRRALAALRIARDAALACWPTPPTNRAQFTLCEFVALPRELSVIDGGKSAKERLNREPKAA